MRWIAPLLVVVACGSTRAESPRCAAFDPGIDPTNAMFSSDPALDRGLRASAQAVRDLDALAVLSRTDVENACRNIAIDLGEPPSPVGEWCAKAQGRIVATGVQVAASIDARVETSILDVLDCDARCDPGVACNSMQTPPFCVGGYLFIDCAGSCATDHGVQCVGTCLGNCTGACDGMPIAAASCTGACDGTCDSACRPPAGSTTVRCAGKCDVPYVLLTCSNGRLVSGCKYDPLCEAACASDGAARASTHVIALRLTLTGTSPQLSTLRATLEQNLPAILLFEQQENRLIATGIASLAQAFVDVAAHPVDGLGGACITAISNEFVDVSRTLMDAQESAAALSLGM